MRLRSTYLALFPVFMFLGACGPILTPMSMKLDDQQQKRVDKGWERALHPADRLDHQAMLDVIMATGIFQLGVDRMSYRSEKWYSDGLVVMEICCDRFAPAVDRFEVSVFDQAGRRTRFERYTRAEVERTLHDLWVGPEATTRPASTEAQRQATAQQAARLARIRELFPEDRKPSSDSTAE
jgi:hypothetical protein